MSEQRKLKDWQVAACCRAASSLVDIGNWGDTQEGAKYWREAHASLCRMDRHGTSDGKPYVEPIRIPTDEDAKSRPMVMVRDYDSEDWQGDMMLIRVQDHGDLRFVVEDRKYLGGEATHWEQCRFPTEAESKEAGQ